MRTEKIIALVRTCSQQGNFSIKAHALPHHGIPDVSGYGGFIAVAEHSVGKICVGKSY